MREPRWITVARHIVLLTFVAISIYPVLNVLSISLRPGDRLRSTDLSIIPADWSFHSYIALFTEQPFLTWLRNSLLVSSTVTLTGVALSGDGRDMPSAAFSSSGGVPVCWQFSRRRCFRRRCCCCRCTSWSRNCTW